MTVAEIEVEKSVEVVLLVDDDDDIVTYFRDYLTKQNIEAVSAEDIASAVNELELLLKRDAERIIIVLDLMFERQDWREGYDFLLQLSTHPAFRGGKIDVIVLTGAEDEDGSIRERVIDAGAQEFYQKGGDLRLPMQSILTYLGRRTLLKSALIEVVDIDDMRSEADVRYRNTNRAIRCKLDVDLIPRDARIPGGSFWLDSYKRFSNGQMEVISIARTIDYEQEATLLRSLLGDDIKFAE
jgi:CheY-like chemotaxis protein